MDANIPQMTDEARVVYEATLKTLGDFDNPLIEYRPNGDAEVNAVFGDPTRGGQYLRVVDPKWYTENIVECHPDNKKYLPVHPKLARYYWPLHKKAEPTMREFIRRVDLVAPGYITEDGGTWCWVFRRIRHDTPEKAEARKQAALKAGKHTWIPLRDLSRHSWGCALDLEPNINHGEEFDPGKTPMLFSKAWMKKWPKGITPAILAAAHSVSLRCGAEWRGYVDPMHFEICGSHIQV
jgi:hypothetical protein